VLINLHSAKLVLARDGKRGILTTSSIRGLLNERDADVRFEARPRTWPRIAPFCDDTTTSRDTAFAKIRARVRGTELAAAILGAG
jgi:hypothetical protein